MKCVGVLTLGAAALAVVTFIAPAVAAPLTVSFTGSVLTSDFGGAPASAPVSGSFTYDSAAPDTDPSAVDGLYANAVSQFSFSAGIFSGALTANFKPDLHGIQMFNDDPDVISVGLAGDAMVAFAQVDPVEVLDTPGGFTHGLIGLTLVLIDPTEQAFGSDALPLTLPDASEFSYAWFSMKFVPLSGVGPAREITATIDSLFLVTVPAPGAAALLGVCLFGLAGLRRTIAVL